MNIAAGIVLFYPNKDRFVKCLNVIIGQVDCVFLYDNVGDESDYFLRLSSKIIYLTDNENKGMAFALNKLMEEAEKRNFDWLITFDQDTFVPSNLVTRYREFFFMCDVGLICPQVIDKRRTYIQPKISNDYSEIEFCITSACCTNIRAWRAVGGFDNWLFIDFVDNDFCKRIRLSKYKIIRINDLVIEQEFGDITLKSKKFVRFYLWLSSMIGNLNIAKLSYRKNVSPSRVYYVHRNLLYLNKKYKYNGGIGYENFYCKSFFGFLLYFSFPSFIRAQKKKAVMKSIFKGLLDGIKSEVLPYKRIDEKNINS